MTDNLLRWIDAGTDWLDRALGDIADGIDAIIWRMFP